jgi:hypothetical protein
MDEAGGKPAGEDIAEDAVVHDISEYG